MNKEKITETMDNLSTLLGYSAPAGSKSEGTILGDEYTIAANIINNHSFNAGIDDEYSEDDINKLYAEFQEKFSPEVLKNLSDEDVLTYIFITAEGTNDSMCYHLEFNSVLKKCFGSISGGSSYKYNLFQRKDDAVWVTGSPKVPQELSDEEAILLGKEIRDKIVLGAEIIRSSTLQTVKDYEDLDKKLNDAIDKYATYGWIHKYYHMIFPDLFSTTHSEDWQKHILFGLQIKPNELYYAKSGQIAIIARLAQMSVYSMIQVAYDKFGDIKQFCRLGTTNDEKCLFPDWCKEGIAAIGWNGTMSLEEYQDGTGLNKAALANALIQANGLTQQVASRKANELILFYQANKNTIFVAMNGEKLLALGDEIGEYRFDDSKVFAHYKPISWHAFSNTDMKLPHSTEGYLTSCINFKNEDNILFLYKAYFHDKEKLKSADITPKSDENEVEFKPRTNKVHPLNQIIYGAPGTGKTFSSAAYAVAIVENDTVENINIKYKSREDLMLKYNEYSSEGLIVFTTFHQSYGYEEFIQGIRPDTTKTGDVKFKVVDGVFKKLADTAKKDDKRNFVLIIDEINRGNISKVFGELITLIEDDKRLGEINHISVTLPLGEEFSIPNNLYILGTMNSADKSISLIDTALRRRFDFIEMPPNPDLVKDTTLHTVLKNLNMHLCRELRSTDLLIGHSFFIDKTADDLCGIMNKHIIPLLYEYFYDDAGKVKKALDCLNGTPCIIKDILGKRLFVEKGIDE